MNISILLLLPLSLNAFGAASPAYLDKPPASFCIGGAQIDGRLTSCNDNPLFMEAAQKCFREFKILQKNTATQVQARFAKNNGEKQKQDFANNAADNQEAVAAHQYLISVGEMAVKELDDYFDYMEHPEHAESDAEVLSEPCFMETASALDQLVNDFEDMVDDMKEAKSIETAMSAISSQNKTKIDASSLNPLIKGGNAQGTGNLPAGASKGRDSDVSGIKENEAKKKIVK